MLELHHIRENAEKVIQQLSVKNFNAKEIIPRVITIDEKRRNTQKELDALLNESNVLARQTGELFKTGKKEEAQELREKSTALKELIKTLERQFSVFEKELEDQLVLLPNIPHDAVPPGRGAEGNVIIHEEGKIPVLSSAVPHWELASEYGLIDFEAGNKITGAGFPVYMGRGARLQRALINFFIDRAVTAGYTEVQPPVLVNEASAFGTGQLPDKEGQMYHVGADNLYLIPTAEVPVTNLMRDCIINAADFPLKYTAYTSCFRREAGSYGKEVRGLNRLHQFDKVEVVQVQHPDKSYDTLEEMKEYVAGLLRMLELPFRIVKLCGGDMSFASALTYDMEVYSAAQQRWLEVSSVSNFESFQSNRLKLRFREGNAKPRLAHTLNGSALALPRIVAALMENNQSPGGIHIPSALIPYTGFDRISK